MEAVRRRQGADLRAAARSRRLQRRRPGRPSSARAPSVDGAPASASPSARRGPASSASSTDLLVDRAFDRGPREHEAGRSSADVCATSARCAPHNVANALAAAALARAYGVPAGRGPGRAARLPARTRTASRTSRRSTASPTSTTPRPPTRTPPPRRWRRTSGRLDRRRAGQGRRRSTSWSPASADGCAAPCCSARDRALIAEALARHAPGCPGGRGRRHRHWGDGSTSCAPPRPGPRRATPCCWPPPAPRWTCSPTTASAATRSPPPCAACRRRPPARDATHRAQVGGRRGSAGTASIRPAGRTRGGARLLDRPLTLVLPGARLPAAAAGRSAW